MNNENSIRNERIIEKYILRGERAVSIIIEVRDLNNELNLIIRDC